ncbi:MAG: class I SAM-dependent methyltransferase [Magnetococcales bacterium]|nr:class I SAM-dependent methyltransferase [Magnetococcales bacterium]
MKEEEIRPQRIFDEYLRLAKQDTGTYFGEVEKVSGACPACETVGEHAFVKYGFTYETCPNCHSLYVNPRPVAEAFSKYYTESPSSQFWATTFYKETAEARREKLWKPKARLIRDTMAKYAAAHHTLIDIGGGFGLFAEEIRNLFGQAPIVIEPGPHLAVVCREKSLPVIQKFLEHVTPDDLPKGPKTFVSFELFEHLHDPAAFLHQLNGLMATGDLFIFTTLSGSGVDIQALWEDSKSVTPPHHLNFLNPRSVALLLERLGFQNLAVTTPGKLDIDILVNNHAAIKDRFWQTFVATATDAEKAAWQEMIASTGWSSHMMVVCRKP